MRKRLALIGSGVGVLALAISLIAFPAASQTSPARTFTVCEKNQGGYDHHVDVGGKGFGPGDMLLESYALYNPKSGAKVGRDVATLHIVRLLGQHNAVFRADGTFFFQKGKIEVTGTGKFASLRKGASFSIIGGTRIWNQAHGTMLAKVGRCAGSRGTRFTFNAITG
jgi:hypothetical protein